MAVDYYTELFGDRTGDVLFGINKKYEEATVDERNLSLYKTLAKRDASANEMYPGAEEIYIDLMERYDPRRYAAMKKATEDRIALEKRQREAAERKAQEEYNRQVQEEIKRQRQIEERRKATYEKNVKSPPNSLYTQGPATQQTKQEASKVKNQTKQPAKTVYNQEQDSQQVKNEASKVKNANKTSVNVTQDYVNPRTNQIKRDKKNIDDITWMTPEEKKYLKDLVDRQGKIEELDPGSTGNITGMKNAPVSNRQAADNYQAEMIKKHVPAINTTTADKIDPPKKPATISNHVPTNAELFQDEVTIIDAEWISSRFLVPSKDLMQIDKINRFFSTTGWKYNSTQLGANIAINARPQFTRYCDIRGNNRSVMNPSIQSYKDGNYSRDVTVGFTTDIGIGRYYSESIDDNATLVFLEFGLPKFNSLFTYFIRAVTYEDMYIANYGTIPVGYTLGKGVGVLFNLYFFPLTSIIIYGAKALFTFFSSGPLDYYYFNSTMPQYWATANNIVNKMAVELGLLNPVFDPAEPEANKIGAKAKIDRDDFTTLASIMPGIFFPSSHYIDLFYVACRPQILANKQAKAEYEAYQEGKTDRDFVGYVTDGKHTRERLSPGGGASNSWDNAFKLESLAQFFKKWVLGENTGAPGKSEFAPKDPNEMEQMNPAPADPSGSSEEGGGGDAAAQGGGSNITNEGMAANKSDASKQNSTFADGAIRATGGFFDTLQSWMSKGADNFVHKTEAFDATVREGAKYAVFAVDFQGAQSESISSSVSDIELGGMLKGAGGAARNVKFNLSGGNLIPGMSAITDTLKNFAAGALDSMSFGLSNVISTLMGNAFIEFPKKWDDSEISLPQITYTMNLISPYGNTMSQLQNIYIPLAMIMAGSLPLAAGERSYTSPYLCQVFNKGVQKIKLGMITSVSINRGSANLPFNRWKHPLAVEVSFTVTDFSTKMAAPVNSGIFGGEFNMRLEQDSKFDEYIGVLCGKDLHTDIYFMPKLKKKISRLAMAVTQTFAGSSVAVNIGSSPLTSWMGLFVKERNIGSNQNNSYFY